MSANELNNLLLRIEAIAKKNRIHALHLLSEAEDDFPQDPRIHSVRGMIHFETEDYKAAARSFQRAYELGARDIQVLYMLANSYFVQGEFRLALIYYNQITPETVELAYNKALALSHLGRTRESIKLLIEATRKFPAQMYVYMFLTEQYMHQEEYEEALETLSEAERRLPVDPGIYALMGVIYAKTQNWFMCYSSFRKAESCDVSLFPDHYGIYAKAAAKAGLYDEAIGLFDTALMFRSESAQVYEDYCAAALDFRDIETAEEIINIARKNLTGITPTLRLLEERLNHLRMQK